MMMYLVNIHTLELSGNFMPVTMATSSLFVLRPLNQVRSCDVVNDHLPMCYSIIIC